MELLLTFLGNIDIIKISGIKINYVDLIIKNLKGEENSIKTNFEYNNNVCTFSVSNEINNGINLENLTIGSYYLFIKVTYSNSDIKYYSLFNDSECKDITYYTITKNNSNNKINIAFNTYENTSYLSLFITPSPKLPDDVYDIAIDPSRGGKDLGYTSGDYTESDIVLKYALNLKSKLEDLGLKVFISRDSSMSSTEDTLNNMYDENGRINILNASHAKLLISLQMNGNSYNKSNGGVEVYAPCSCNLDFATTLANNIVTKSNSYYSENPSFKKANEVYVRNFTNSDILAFKAKAQKANYEPYNITLSTPYLYIIRETGGISTNAFVDGRNKNYGANKYYNSNTGIESYVISLGYMSIQKDLDNILNNSNLYIDGILESIKSYCNI